MKKFDSKKLLGFWLCFGLIAIVMATYIYSNSKFALPLSSNASASINNANLKTLTLFQAIDLAEERARATDSSAQLVKVISVDAVESAISGEEGLRGTWNFFFTNCIMTISNGKVTQEQPSTSFSDRRPFSKKDLVLNSSDAVRIAKVQKKLRPGDPSVDWAVGYNFNLEYMSFKKDPTQERLIFEVVGISPKGNFARVDIDATTGKIILAEEKTYDANENPIWREF